MGSVSYTEIHFGNRGTEVKQVSVLRIGYNISKWQKNIETMDQVQ